MRNEYHEKKCFILSELRMKWRDCDWPDGLAAGSYLFCFFKIRVLSTLVAGTFSSSQFCRTLSISICYSVIGFELLVTSTSHNICFPLLWICKNFFRSRGFVILYSGSGMPMILLGPARSGSHLDIFLCGHWNKYFFKYAFIHYYYKIMNFFF